MCLPMLLLDFPWIMFVTLTMRKKKLISDVYILSNLGVIVQNGSKLSLVSNVKGKQDNDLWLS